MQCVISGKISKERNLHGCCTFESNTWRSRIAIVFIIFNTEIKSKSKIWNNREKDVFSDKKRRKEIFLLKPLALSVFIGSTNTVDQIPRLGSHDFSSRLWSCKATIEKLKLSIQFAKLSVRIIIYERIATVDKYTCKSVMRKAWIKVKVFVYFTHWSSSDHPFAITNQLKQHKKSYWNISHFDNTNNFV